MSKLGIFASVIIAAVITAGITYYTNIEELAKPRIDTAFASAKDSVSKVQGKDVVSKTEEIASEVKNVTSQIKIQNPIESKKLSFSQ